MIDTVGAYIGMSLLVLFGVVMWLLSDQSDLEPKKKHHKRAPSHKHH